MQKKKKTTKYWHCYDPELDKMNREECSHDHAVYRKDSNNRQITRDNRHVT